MAKKTLTPKQKVQRFWIGIGIYAAVFLLITALGLVFFWNFISAFEASRPENIIKDFMATVTPQRISVLDAKTLDAIDTNLQSREDAQKYIEESIHNITYANNVKLSSDVEKVYMILDAGRTLGQVTMSVTTVDKYGFEHWEITQETYDFSHLIGSTASVTVPSQFSVYAGEVKLNPGYITESDIHFESLEEYYQQYDLPTMCTYTAGPILGQLQLSVTDAEGNPVTIGADTDMEQFLDNCSEEEISRLEGFVDGFVQEYTDFTCVAGGKDNIYYNYEQLIAYMVPGGDLTRRMAATIEGLIWVANRQASVDSVTINRCLRLKDGVYLADFTYVANVVDYSESYQTGNSIKMIIVETGYGLRAESMVNYDINAE